MDLIEVGNVSTTSGVAAGAHDEQALLQRSINENTILFQQGRSWEKIGACLRRYAAFDRRAVVPAGVPGARVLPGILHGLTPRLCALAR